MNLTLRQLKAFLELARLHSFTRAAESMHITQAGLSSLLRDLEGQLDCRLFDRTTRSVELTVAGHQLLATAENTVINLEATASSIRQLEAEARHVLTVAATPLVSSLLLPDVCRDFRVRFPNVTVRILDVDRDQIQADVQSGLADIGLGMFFEQASGMERTAMFTCDLVCLMPSENKIRRKRREMRSMQWSDLRGVPLLALPADNPVQQQVDIHLGKIGRANEARPTYHHFHTLLSMVEAGFGSAVLPSFVIAMLERMKFEAVRLERPHVSIDFFAIRKKGRTRSAFEHEFVRSLAAVMEARCAIASPKAPAAKLRN
ncbi:LysR family transcriptional regulator [Paraburkholderia sediminicola]|uniref:LysR family transcriptional regulator n=1 Tax=Paraburkholderia sediminicola TaxID=458836 RepID=UPI0038BA6B83